MSLLIGFRQYESVYTDTVSVYLKWLQLIHPVGHCGLKLALRNTAFTILRLSNLLFVFWLNAKHFLHSVMLKVNRRDLFCVGFEI